MEYFKEIYSHLLYSSFKIFQILIEVLYGIFAFKDSSCGEALIIFFIVLKFFNNLSEFFLI